MTSPECLAPVDDGLQAERTALAWVRTGLLGAFVGLFALRQAFLEGVNILLLAIMALVVLTGPAVVVLTSRRRLSYGINLMQGRISAARSYWLLSTVLITAMAALAVC